jgi:hypothetical protein
MLQGNVYSFEAKANMIYPRHGHSACAVGETQIVVTGGRHGSGNECEIFERSGNKWRELPKLLRRRHYHSSCAFEGRSVFVFCGIDNDTRGYINSIERLQLNEGLQSWQKFVIKKDEAMFAPRQGLGTCQINSKGILIMGGYTGAHTSDSFFVDVQAQTIEKTQSQMPMPCFPFAVPTLSDVNKQIAFTVDWCSYKLMKYEQGTWSAISQLRQTN